MFEYTAHHNVYELFPGETTCPQDFFRSGRRATLRGASDAGGGSGTNTNRVRVSLDAPGVRTFACEIGSHCDAGQIVVVTISEAPPPPTQGRPDAGRREPPEDSVATSSSGRVGGVGGAGSSNPARDRPDQGSVDREAAASDVATSGRMTGSGGPGGGSSGGPSRLDQRSGARLPARAGDSVEPRQKRRIASSLEIPGPDLATIAVGTPARAEFELQFKTTMAERLGELVQPVDIVIEDIRSGIDTGEPPAAGRRVLRRLQQDGIAVDFSILADEEAATAAQSAAATLQASDAPLVLSIGGEVVMVTPSAAMAPPAEPVVADLDCEGAWACDANRCVLTFTRTQAQSGGGAGCPGAPLCRCTERDGGDGSALASIVVIALASTAALSAAYCCYARRATAIAITTNDKTAQHSPPVVTGSWQHAADTEVWAHTKAEQRHQHPQFAPGSPVQIWSKSSQTWCHGRVVKVGGDAVEVIYSIGKIGAKERRKTLRVDSDCLRASQKQSQRRRRGGPNP